MIFVLVPVHLGADLSDSEEPFHRGERAVQDRVGVGARMAVAGRRAIRDFMDEQHREFFEQLPFVVVGSVDDSGQPWASILAGPPGFMTAASPHMLTVGAPPLAGDPLVLAVGRPVGLLGIEPHTRRRNRMNGIVHNVDSKGFAVRVQQSFGNCPKYIVPREATFSPRVPGEVVRSTGLDEVTVRMLRSADTFFIASAYPAGEGESRSHGVDVSHRGGEPGFISVEDGVLRVPDYVGNNYFNTLGNIAVNPKAGLLVADFESADLLFLAVRVEIVWEGAGRVLMMRIDEIIRMTKGLMLTAPPPQ